MMPTKEQLESSDWWDEYSPISNFYVKNNRTCEKHFLAKISDKKAGDYSVIAVRPPVPTPSKVDPVNNPSHYTSHPSGVECIQITEHMGFNLGNAVKYIWRCDEKLDAIEDLEKAEFYIKREINKRKKIAGS